MEVKDVSNYKKLKSDVNVTDYKAYIKFLKETKRSDISYKMFTDIVVSVHEEMISKVQQGPYAITVPGLGVLKMLKVKPIAKPHAMIDWGRYNKTKVWAPHRNNHSDGFIYKFHMYPYIKKSAKLGFFDFQPSRAHQRALAKVLKNND
jgi:hypothetical protein